MDCKIVKNEIINWLKEQSQKTNQKGFVVGVSGGVDSALVSTLCAETGYPTICVSLPIHQPESHVIRADEHIKWLEEKYYDVGSYNVDLTNTFETFKKDILVDYELALVNARSRLRAVALYTFANSRGYLVVGTGNKVEDYGIGFFTKFGDGAVDISPIGDLLKTEVRELASYLGVNEKIVNAVSTDGLWENDRSDESQIGATYEELEWAMKYFDENIIIDFWKLSIRQFEILKIYKNRHDTNRHKMSMPPICKLKNK